MSVLKAKKFHSFNYISFENSLGNLICVSPQTLDVSLEPKIYAMWAILTQITTMWFWGGVFLERGRSLTHFKWFRRGRAEKSEAHLYTYVKHMFKCLQARMLPWIPINSLGDLHSFLKVLRFKHWEMLWKLTNSTTHKEGFGKCLGN